MLLIKAPKTNKGYTPVIPRGSYGLRFLEFGIVELTKDFPEWDATTGETEATLDVYSGRCRIEVRAGHGKSYRFDSVGAREHALAGMPDMVYLPPRSKYNISRLSDYVKVGVFAAPSRATAEPALVKREEAKKIAVGKENWTREVITSIGPNVPAEKLIVGETVNPPGNWSSSPAHKHDSRRHPNEVPMEEVYYFQIDPPQGFALMRVYTAPDDPQPLNEVYVVENGDTVAIPRGYHPVAAAPGYKVHYTWALAGEERRYGAWTDDPRHAWIKQGG